MVRVALIFQHGDCPAHYALAAELSLRAFEKGNPEGGWLYTAAIDRYLQSIGKLQQYGTQYVIGLDAHFHLCPVSGSISDDERHKYGLPGLDTLEKRAAELDASFPQEPGYMSFIPRIPLVGELFSQAFIYKTCGQP